MDQKTESLDEHTDEELLGVLLREIAKAGNEIRNAEADVQKAQKRLRFGVLLANRLLDRKKINGFTTSSS